MTDVHTDLPCLLEYLTAAIARIEALSPEEARQAHVRLLADHKSRAEGSPLTVEELAIADLDRLLLERMGLG